MPLIPWTDSLSVGVPSIDAQHRVLFDTLNELHEAMLKGQAKALTGPLLHSMLGYTRGHFSAEEAMMAAANYPGLAGHRVRHRDLALQMEGYATRFERGEITLNVHLLHFLGGWLTNHIQQEDRAYGPCLHTRGIR